METYLGKAGRLRLAVLAASVSRESLAAVALKHGVTAEACYKYARRARAIFPTLHTEKLTPKRE